MVRIQVRSTAADDEQVVQVGLAWTFPSISTSTGTRTLVVTATDNDGNATASATRTIQVVP